MKKEFKVWAMTCIALWWLTPSKTYSQQDSLHQQYLREVVISAGKLPKKQSQNGRVVDIIERDEILKSGSRDISQLLQSRSGIFINGANGAPSKDRGIYLRGASPQYTLIMIDGVPVYDPSGVNGVFDLRLLSLNNVERIEVLKGAQSTLYGTDAMAGVINIITRQGKKGIQPSASIAYGSYDQLNADATLTGKTGRVSYAAGYSHFSGGGISEARDPEASDTFDKDAFSQHALNASIGADLTTRITLSSFIQYSRMDGDYDAGAFTDAAGNRYEGENLRYGLSLKSDAANAWQVQVARNRLDRAFSSDFGDFSSTGTLLHMEGYYSYGLSETLRVVGGLMFQQQDITTEEIEDARIISPYATVIYNPLPGLNLEGGIRYNHHSEFGSEVTFSFNPSWQLSPAWKVFGNYSTGFKAPTLSQLYGQFGPNPDLLPERSRSIEAGLSWNRNGSDVRLAVFSRRIEDIIIYTDRYVNSDLQDVCGFELEPSFRIGDNVQLTAGYTFLDGETAVNASDSTFSGLLRQPKHAFRLAVTYQPITRLSTNVEAQYFGDRTDVFFSNETFTNQLAALDPYMLIDIRLSYQLTRSGIWLQGSVRNLFDVDYYEVFGYSVLGRNMQLGLRWDIGG